MLGSPDASGKQVPYALLYLPIDPNSRPPADAKEGAGKPGLAGLSNPRADAGLPGDFPRQQQTRVKLSADPAPENPLGVNILQRFEDSIRGFERSEQLVASSVRRAFAQPRQTLQGRPFIGINRHDCSRLRRDVLGPASAYVSREALREGDPRDGPDSPCQDLKQINIQILGGRIVTKYFKDSTLIAQILRSLLKAELRDIPNQDIEAYSLFRDGSKLNIVDTISELKLQNDDVLLLENTKLLLSKKPLPADVSVVPVLNSPGYATSPAFEALCRMTEEELAAVDNFSVHNAWGQITFLKPVDLRGLNLDDIIQIEKKAITVYRNDALRPKFGTGLNVPVKMTFRQYGLDAIKSNDSLMKKINLFVQRNNAQLIEICRETDSITFIINPQKSEP